MYLGIEISLGKMNYEANVFSFLIHFGSSDCIVGS